jgi:polar amino acid transport system permease protein
VVVPQAILNTAPPIGNNLIALLKESAIVSVIGVAELVHSSQLAISETYRPFEFYVVAAALYYILNLALEGILKFVETRVEATR